ncbi:hypothetical protein QYM36_015748 [Artemia franciscana]|uniref:Uncharacterized protein n=1 Tax=Artemia franciscana TaxID=6661 RepID=A0AA88KVS6_ARTSF|nr:hypothetical protein QYM36_015748 [Artemia franciscana]
MKYHRENQDKRYYSLANPKKLEVELATLKSNNARLTAALQESTANVEEWKRQLEAFKEENIALKSKLLDTETNKGNELNNGELKKEITTLRLKCDSLETELKTKDEKVKDLSTELKDSLSVWEILSVYTKSRKKMRKPRVSCYPKLTQRLTAFVPKSILVENLRFVFHKKIKEIEDAHIDARRNELNNGELKKEITTLRLKCDSLETELKTKDEKVKDLSTELKDSSSVMENFKCLYEESQENEKTTRLVLSQIDAALNSIRSQIHFS